MLENYSKDSERRRLEGEAMKRLKEDMEQLECTYFP